MNARLILEAAERTFPLEEMGEDFKGHHSVTLHEGKLALTVWASGTCHTFSLGATEEVQSSTEAGCAELLGAIGGLLANQA